MKGSICDQGGLVAPTYRETITKLVNRFLTLGFKFIKDEVGKT